METTYPVLCAWCGRIIGQTLVPHSHGICPACQAGLLGVPLLSEQELGDLPFGVIELDRTGIILTYNKAEEDLSKRSSSQVMGKHFFREVAPCTSVKAFEGRFQAFISSDSAPVNFNFTFKFPERKTKVNITFLKSNRSSVFVLVKALREGIAGA